MTVQAIGAAAAGSDRDGARVAKVSIGAALLAAGLAALFVAFPLGVANDYPNHLARTYIEGFIGSAARLRDYYTVNYGLIPDLAMDLVVPWLSKVAGVYGAGAIMIALASISAPLAGIVLARKLNNPAAAWLPLAGFASVFNFNLDFGFVNFIATAGLGLLAFAFWVGAAPGWRRALIFAPVGLLLLACHALGFLLFGYLALLWEIAPVVRRRPAGALKVIRQLMFRDSIAFLPGLGLLAVAVIGAPDIEQAVAGETDWLASRAVAFLAPFRFGLDPLAALVAAASAAFIYGGLAFGLRSGLIRIDRRMAVVLAGLGALAFGLPEYVLGIWGLHFRFPSIFVVVAAASVSFSPAATSRLVKAAGAGLAVILALQAANGASKLAATNADGNVLRAALASLPKGARLLPVIDPATVVETDHHGAALAVIEAEAYVPTLFTNTSPVGVRPEWRHIHLPAGMPIAPARLYEVAEFPTPAPANGYWSLGYFHGWAQTFTHVIYPRPVGAAGLDDPHLCLEVDAPKFALYRVKAIDAPCG